MSGSDLTQGAWDELQADRDRWRARADALAKALRESRRIIEGGKCEVHGWWVSQCGPCGDAALVLANVALREYDEEAGR